MTAERVGVDERHVLLGLYRGMATIREFETQAHNMFKAGELPGFLHLYAGEEAVAVGVSSVLRPDDYVTSTHRGHGHMIARGGDLRLMMAELLGRATGYCHGKGGSMHIADFDLHVLGANGIVGASLPIATGAGLAAQYRGEDTVSVCFFGDAASNRGTFHESLNLAAIWKLPVLFVCENNMYGVGMCQRDHMVPSDVAERASSYGIEGVVVDGNDVLAVRTAAAEAAARAREGGGPTLIECKTWRHYGHFVGDDATYRDSAEHEEWLARDPVANFRGRLLDQGAATPDELAAIDAQIRADLLAAAEFALASAWPTEADLVTDVFAD